MLPPGPRWSTHHRVPVELGMLFDFLNTVDERRFAHHVPGDELVDPPALVNWLTQCDLVPPGTTASTQDLGLATQLRAALRRCAAANGHGTIGDDLTAIMDALPLRVVVQPDGGLTLAATMTAVPGALATLLACAVRASANGSWRRIKMCAADDCRVVFYDHSKPRNGRWCDTFGCGNRLKVRAYRQRTRGASTDRP